MCGSGFEVTAGDRDFYQKMNVPEPKCCPQCRLARRMSYRNERKLYRRKCDVTGKPLISMFSEQSPVKICDKNHWFSSEFDPLDYGREFDFSRSFFENFHDLLQAIPLPSLRVEHSENCEYNSDTSDSKNCYLCSRTHKCADMLYTYRGNSSSSCTDCLQVVENCEFLYECVGCATCYDGMFLEYSERCSQSAFLSHCRGCTNCFLCTNLDKKEFCFLNEQLTREQYAEKLATFDLGDRRTFAMALEAFAKLKSETIVPEDGLVNAENCTGRGITNSSNCHECYEVREARDCRYLFNVMKYSDGMDCYTGGRNSELVYECTSASGSYNVKFCVRASNSRDVTYGMFISSCQNLFGCIGLQNANHCILNKKYSPDEYEVMRDRIIDHMKSTGEWGEFFPVALSPFAYNETIAQEYFPVEKSVIEKNGCRWHTDDPKEFAPQKFVVPEKISDVDETILKEILACEKCGKNYKITMEELKFYKKQEIPVPAICPDCRHARRFALRKVQPFKK